MYKLLIFAFLPILFLSLQKPTLKIEIGTLKNSKGQIQLELLDENENPIKGVSKEIENNSCIIVIENLEPGKYAFKYFHDENRNKELDTNWMGIPKEGFGFSNNAKGKFGPPKFDKTIFEFNTDVTMNCDAIYLK